MRRRSAGTDTDATAAERNGGPPGPTQSVQASGQLAGEELGRFLLRALLDTTTDQIYFKDLESRFIRISTAQALKFGLACPDEAIGKTDFDFFSDEHARQAFEDERRIIRTGEPLVGIEEKETWENGREAWVSTSKMPLRDESGSIIGTFGVSREITLEKLQRDEITRQNDLLETFLETTPEDVYFKDRESRFVRVSRALRERLGVTCDEEILGKTDFDFFTEEHARRSRSNELEVMTSGVPQIAVEERELRPDGSEHWVVVTKMPLRDADGMVIGTFGVNRDITEQKRLEAELRHSQKMEAVGRLAGGIAHDFNNLLMAISGYADLLRQGVSEDAKLRGQADEIVAACERAAGLTGQLLTYSRRHPPEARVADVGDFLTGMADMLSRLIGEDIRIELDIYPERMCVRIDPTQLEQVVLNLALNARDAMPAGGRLRLEVRPEGTTVLLSVSDSGHGFSAELKEHVFEPYFTTKQRGHGTGLGLATVYAIVQQADGTIEVESAPDQGAVFTLRFPRVANSCGPEPAGLEPPEPDAARQSGGTILVVEDEPSVRTLVSEFLEAAGHTVVAASSAEEALALPDETVFDLVLTDVIMPGMSGTALAEQLKRTHPEVAVLLMSGYSDERLDPHDVEGNGLRLIEKPFRLSELLDLVTAGLRAA